MKKIILQIDDDDDDLLIVKDAVAAMNLSVTLTQEKDPRAALDYLNAIKNKDELPCLIIVDFNMPVMNGKEFIATVRSNRFFDEIAIFAFTTFSLPADKEYCNQFNAQCIVKPLYFEQLKEIVAAMMEHCQTPHADPQS